MSDHSHHPHTSTQSAAAAAEEKRIAKEMAPFLIYAAIPVLLIVFIALKWGPSY
jgi:hypothetical protein